MPYTSHMNKKTGELIDEKIMRLLGLLYRTERMTEARFDVKLQPVGLTCAQYHVLKVLTQAGEPMPLGQLAEKSRSVRSNATQMIDRLAAEGLVERVFDAADRRRVLAQITEEGRRRHEAGAQAVIDVEQELIEHFSQEERDQLTQLLSRLEQLWKS
ncbi:MAG: MarR family transcriptional regulator [Ktedonobacteraceae bacterium]|nr:MarR family transcriptional regulator [Ktedonobacteraceae bacterium]MBO0791335.1 MarR family transcriptional regulator [Ktedonobacteraceae bacterium]